MRKREMQTEKEKRKKQTRNNAVIVHVIHPSIRLSKKKKKNSKAS